CDGTSFAKFLSIHKHVGSMGRRMVSPDRAARLPLCPDRTVQRSFFPTLSGPDCSRASWHSATPRCGMALSRNHCVKRRFACGSDLSLSAGTFGLRPAHGCSGSSLSVYLSYNLVFVGSLL